MLNKRFLCTAGCTFTVLHLVSTAAITHAATLSLDWGEVAQSGNWSDGQQSGNFTVGDGTIAINFVAGDGVNFVGFGDGVVTPAINSILNGIESDQNPSLHLQIDPDQVGLTEGDYSVKMGVDFNDYSSPLTDVSFWLYDVDLSGDQFWQDRVSVIGFSGTSIVTPIFDWLYDDTTTLEMVDAYTIDGINNAFNDADQSNVLVSFAQKIDRFELLFTDGDDIGIINPNPHGIGIGDIHFSQSESVPEPSTFLGLAIVSVMAGGLKFRKQFSSY